MNDTPFNVSIKGHVHIEDKTTNEVLLDKHNAIHNRNMATIMARGLANALPSVPGAPGILQIYRLRLGNGGSAINSLNQITYQAPNVTGANANLYNRTYSELVDSLQAETPPENSVSYTPPSGDNLSVVTITATIGAGEPGGQDPTDSSNPDQNSQYAFDELGLFTSDDLLLTHIIFSPILKTANRELVITYTLTISVS